MSSEASQQHFLRPHSSMSEDLLIPHVSEGLIVCLQVSQQHMLRADLELLYRRHPPLGEEDKTLHALLVAQPVDGRTADQIRQLCFSLQVGVGSCSQRFLVAQPADGLDQTNRLDQTNNHIIKQKSRLQQTSSFESSGTHLEFFSTLTTSRVGLIRGDFRIRD